LHIDEKALFGRALEARKRSYSPYSGFSVGAALLTESGEIYTGCNIECASYPATNCAERTAFWKAVSEGERAFSAIAVAGGKTGEPAAELCPPCGICRQVMAEFCGPGFRIVLGTEAGEIRVFTLGQLLPQAFGPGMLQGGTRHENV
jgi:cytidine deaminase